MDVSELLDGLNDRQREAVAAPLANLLILAGAGSGKTRVLIHRIAWLMQCEQASPFSILAVTFTNKAAAEMRGRMQNIVGAQSSGMWIGTFHGLAHRLLRAHYMDAGLPEHFQVIDSDDQQRLLRRLIKALNLDEKKWPAKQACWYINGKKDEGLRPQHIKSYGDHSEETLIKIYQAYQEACDRSGLVDFAELLLRAHELWLHKPVILDHYQQRFKHILVDEFQDTNNIQYAWLRMLAGDRGKVMIVGDDDQSIYGWRGAKIENIQKFLNEFEGASTIRLEQNYRSTATILKASNALIANNSGRMGKDLWTEGSEGEPISVYSAFNELDEGRFVVGRIKDWHQQGNSLTDVAILYRNNAQSRVLEGALIQQNLAFRIYGGHRFFERQEIKDALAYLRIINNRQDDSAFERIINTPTRSIGEKTVALIRTTARDNNLTMWQASNKVIEDKLLPARAANAVNGFRDLVNQLDRDISEHLLGDQADHVIQHSGLMTMYRNEKGEKAQTRVENLEELVSACQEFELPEDAENQSVLTSFLTHAALESGEQQADEHQDAVQLMTLHSAKGLEFPLVFMVGVEEGMFPSQQSAEDLERMEEERRLCYVGMTRAMNKLVISHAESRRMYGQENFHTPSRFIREIPSDCVQEIRLQTQVSRPVSSGRFNQSVVEESFEATGFQLGQRVNHSKFGEGTVLNYEGSGPQSRVQINFDEVGSKWLVVAYARLSPA